MPRDKQALTLFQLVRDLLLPERASPKLRRILQRADLFKPLERQETIGRFDGSLARWVVLVATKIKETDGVVPTVDLSLLESIGLRRPMEGRALDGALGMNEWRQMIRDLRALGVALPPTD